MQTQDGYRSVRIGGGCLLAGLAITVIVTKLLSEWIEPFRTASAVSFILFIVIAIAWTIIGALSKVRFGLGKMLGVIWGGAACITCIVASPRAEVISLGISGLVLLTAYLIAGVARANVGKFEEL